MERSNFMPYHHVKYLNGVQYWTHHPVSTVWTTQWGDRWRWRSTDQRTLTPNKGRSAEPSKYWPPSYRHKHQMHATLLTWLTEQTIHCRRHRRRRLWRRTWCGRPAIKSFENLKRLLHVEPRTLLGNASLVYFQVILPHLSEESMFSWERIMSSTHCTQCLPH